MAQLLLSIFSFNTIDYHSLRMPRGALSALGIILCVEGLLHIYEYRLPDPVLWGNIETSAKMHQAIFWNEDRNESCDVLILGPSHARFGISPKVIHEAMGDMKLTVYNGALNGRTYSVLEFVLRKVYVPKLRPRVLVLAVNPLIFNRYNVWMEQNTSEFFEAPKPKALSSKNIARIWRTFLVDHINLYRYRERHKGLQTGHLGDGTCLDEYGFSALQGIYDHKQRTWLNSPEHPYQQIMRKFDFGGPSAKAFVQILQYALDRKIHVFVVNMPFREGLLHISATGAEDYNQFLHEIQVLQYEYGFTWLDYQADLLLGDEDFRDVDHLNVQGARRLSIRLGEDLAKYIASKETMVLSCDPRQSSLRIHHSVCQSEKGIQ